MTETLRVSAALLLFVSSVGYAIDGLAPTRKHAAGTSAAKPPDEGRGSGNSAARNFAWWGFSPSSADAPRPAPGETRTRGGEAPSDGVSEMGVIASKEGDEVGMGREPGSRGPRVHGEAGTYASGTGGGAYSTVVVEGEKSAVTISGERGRGWWP